MTESAKERTDRQLLELLNELRVALPGAQVLLAFLLTVPFSARFDQLDRMQHRVYYACLLCTTAATILLLAPAVYHRLRWGRGGKAETVRVAHLLFLAGTITLGVSVVAAVFLVSDLLYGGLASGLATGITLGVLILTWVVLPLTHGRDSDITDEE